MLEHLPLAITVYIILDAVDECECESRQKILDWSQGLVASDGLSPPSNTSQPTIKLLITTKPNESVFDQLFHFPNLEITNLDTANDIRRLVHTRIEDFARRRHPDLEVAQRITGFLEKNAHGMFLWVALIIQELERRDERLSDDVIASKPQEYL